MPRFLSPEWVGRFNDALSEIDLSATGAGGEPRPFTVAQEVAGGPDGPVRVVLAVGGGRVTLRLAQGGDEEPADVFIALSYEDAAALSRGTLDAAGALAAGRVRVRGDLAALTAGQAVLAAAAERLAPLAADTTY